MYFLLKINCDILCLTIEVALGNSTDLFIYLSTFAIFNFNDLF